MRQSLKGTKKFTHVWYVNYLITNILIQRWLPRQKQSQSIATSKKNLVTWGCYCTLLTTIDKDQCNNRCSVVVDPASHGTVLVPRGASVESFPAFFRYFLSGWPNFHCSCCFLRLQVFLEACGWPLPWLCFSQQSPRSAWRAGHAAPIQSAPHNLVSSNLHAKLLEKTGV
jgi:hypothetical protein